jgi:L-glutamine-phosphate cytidylyltransferase
MRALILAAGHRTASGRPDDLPPASLIRLAGKPLIERQIAALRGGGATEIGIVRGYRAEMIDVPHATYFINERWAKTGPVASLMTAAAWLRAGPVIVSHGDIFYPRDLVHRLGAVRGSLVVAYDRLWRDHWARRFAGALSHAEAFRRSGSGNLLEIGGKAGDADAIDGQPIGLLKFTPNGWQAAETVLNGLDAATCDQLTLVGLLRLVLAAGTISIGTVGIDGQWGVLDTPADTALYESMVAARELSLED